MKKWASMGSTQHKPFLISGTLMALVCLCAGLASCRKADTGPTARAEPPADPLTLALTKVEEDRQEATGRAAVVEVPAELKHYSDRRWFLAVQLAEAHKLGCRPPTDFCELVRLIRAGELVEMPQCGDDHLLYGVGERATEDLFTHYDPTTGKDIPLYPSPEEFQRDFDQRMATLTQIRDRVREIEKQLRVTGRRDRARRKALNAELRVSRKQASELGQEAEVISDIYRSPDKYKELSTEYREIAGLAGDFGGQTYDLSTGDGRRQMKIRLLSFIRPEARDVLLELSSSYKAMFDRPLPITSLIRTGDYQRHLRRTLRNAASTEVPPHTTGLAFDVYDYYMSAAEQQYLMGEIAGMKAVGRVEALRERQNHIHVFAFADGKRPDDESISAEVYKQKSVSKKSKPRRI
jgi:Family of unknown function (DUF5715)